MTDWHKLSVARALNPGTARGPDAVSTLLIIISVVWLAAATAGVALCRAAARGDAGMSPERCDSWTVADERDEVGAPPPDLR
jgi:hypothetical protein